MKPKAITLILALLFGAATSVFAQGYDDDDIYFNPSKAPKPKKETRKTTTYQQPNAIIYYPVEDYPAADTYTPTGGREVSVDDYNRRGIFGESSKTPVTDSILNSEFANTRRIERYYNPDIVSGSNDAELQAYYAQPANVNIIINDPWASPYYSGYWGWSYPRYYTPWGWNSWSWNWGWGPSWSWSWGPSWSWGWGSSWGWGPGWGPSWGPSWGWAPSRPVRPGAVGNYRPGNGYRPGGNYRPGSSYRPGNTPGNYRPSSGGSYSPGSTGNGYRPGRGNSYSRPSNNSNSNNNGYRPGNNRGSSSSWGGGSTGGYRGGMGGGSRGGSGGGRGRH